MLCSIGSASLGTLVPTVAVGETRDASSETNLATAIETGVLEGAELVQEQEQATADGIAAAVFQSQGVSVEQVQPSPQGRPKAPCSKTSTRISTKCRQPPAERRKGPAPHRYRT